MILKKKSSQFRFFDFNNKNINGSINLTIYIVRLSRLLTDKIKYCFVTRTSIYLHFLLSKKLGKSGRKVVFFNEKRKVKWVTSKEDNAVFVLF